MRKFLEFISEYEDEFMLICFFGAFSVPFLVISFVLWDTFGFLAALPVYIIMILIFVGIVLGFKTCEGKSGGRSKMIKRLWCKIWGHRPRMEKYCKCPDYFICAHHKKFCVRCKRYLKRSWIESLMASE